MKLIHYLFLFSFLSVTACTCNRVQPNFEGVLMTGYGRNGESDFKAVSGAQGMLGAGSELYQVPMWEQKGDPAAVTITAKDGGSFTVDPTYTYAPVRGRGVKIIFSYKHLNVDDPISMMDNIEGSVLNQLIVNSYREEARNYTTDSLMNNLNMYEKAVEARLKDEFELKYFSLLNLTSGLTPPASMAKAIEARNNAKQLAEQVRNELEIARGQLEKAKIEAEANRVKSAGLEPRVLQEQWIEAIRTTQNKVIITDGKTPILLGQ
jgi:regulator of protease activity HflC (stomatin/prohibitin superfamily)